MRSGEIPDCRPLPSSVEKEGGALYLSRTVEYALRAVTYMTTVAEGEFATAVDVSRTAGIPVDYLSKILRRMVRKGFLTSRKGHGGGFTLVRPLSGTRIIDVLEAVDYNFDQDHCVWGWPSCSGSRPCPLHSSWIEVKQAFLDWAGKTTLADLRTERSFMERRDEARADSDGDGKERLVPDLGPDESYL